MLDAAPESIPALVFGLGKLDDHDLDATKID